MKETYYFSHDYNATNDPKISYLMSKCGLEGLGLYWVLVEILHQENQGKIKKILLSGIAYKFNIDITLFNNVIDACVEAELFKVEEGYLFSERVLRNKKELDIYRESKSKAGKAGMARRWGNNNSVITENNTAITNDNKGNKRKLNKIKDTTVAKATITFNGETMNYDELTYEPLEGSKKKSTLGKSTMFILVRAYLDAKGIVLEAGESYDANKIGKGLSKLYHECKKDPDETIRRIKLGAEYFKSKELDWTPEAVWRRWEDIKLWKGDKPIYERRKL